MIQPRKVIGCFFFLFFLFIPCSKGCQIEIFSDTSRRSNNDKGRDNINSDGDNRNRNKKENNNVNYIINIYYDEDNIKIVLIIVVTMMTI